MCIYIYIYIIVVFWIWFFFSYLKFYCNFLTKHFISLVTLPVLLSVFNFDYYSSFLLSFPILDSSLSPSSLFDNTRLNSHIPRIDNSFYWERATTNDPLYTTEFFIYIFLSIPPNTKEYFSILLRTYLYFLDLLNLLPCSACITSFYSWSFSLKKDAFVLSSWFIPIVFIF